GNFYGVFREGELLASAGLYIFDEIGRFQQVRTMEKARGQGMCKALIQFMYTQNANQIQEAVIVADEDYHALKLYEGLGFKSKENQYDLTKVIKD
ncbi:MAG: GNAT family N-acetyltransferase, partial [Aureispira sp.]|nr:GNAT family N-acetyltransferase [Aureispira sp.]